jgi:hypothetical protein
MYMDTKKLINQKKYVMKNRKITEVENEEEIKKELKEKQRSHITIVRENSCVQWMLESRSRIQHQQQKEKRKIINKRMITVNYKNKLKMHIIR